MATRSIWAKRIGSGMAWTFQAAKRISGKTATGNTTNTVGNIHYNVVRRVVPNYHANIREDLKYVEVKIRGIRAAQRRLMLIAKAFTRKDEIKDLNFISFELETIEKSLKCIDSHLIEGEEKK